MTNETDRTTAEEPWSRIDEQLRRMQAKIADLETELERQRLEKVSLASRLAEVEGGGTQSGKKLSRAGLLKAAAVGAAGLAGAGMVTGPRLAQAGMVTPGNTYDGDVVLGVVNSASAPTVFYAANGNSGWSGAPAAIEGAPAPQGTGANQLSASTQVSGVLGTGIGPDRAGVVGVNDNGYGGSFRGGKAALTLWTNDGVVPPDLGTSSYDAGDLWVGNGNGSGGHPVVWLCTATGNPGTWVPLMFGNSNDATDCALFYNASTNQYSLTGSDGVTWVAMDPNLLGVDVTPQRNAIALFDANCDLWTSQAGYNQDIGIMISGGQFGTGQLLAWKESGGFAGTFSPNAAFVHTLMYLPGGVTYRVKIVWKTNKPAPGATIWAGAGPIAGSYSPTWLTVLLIPAK
jgi:hypothetical protein